MVNKDATDVNGKVAHRCCIQATIDSFRYHQKSLLLLLLLSGSPFLLLLLLLLLLRFPSLIGSASSLLINNDAVNRLQSKCWRSFFKLNFSFHQSRLIDFSCRSIRWKPVINWPFRWRFQMLPFNRPLLPYGLTWFHFHLQLAPFVCDFIQFWYKSMIWKIQIYVFVQVSIWSFERLLGKWRFKRWQSSRNPRSIFHF